MSSSQAVQKALLKLARSWPKDPARPEFDFGEAIRRATLAESNSKASKTPGADVRRSQAALDRLRSQSLAALERLRSNEGLREYPTPRNVLHPASSPQYYERLLDAITRVTHGQSIAPTLGERVRRFFGMLK